jgi:hypothetical protein
MPTLIHLQHNMQFTGMSHFHLYVVLGFSVLCQQQNVVTSFLYHAHILLVTYPFFLTI